MTNNTNLTEYINKMRAGGNSDESIAQSLRENGWDEATISNLFTPKTNQMSSPENNPVPVSSNISKWSTAAFFGTWVWLFYHKQNKMATKFFLFWLALFFINLLPWITSTSLADIASNLQTLQIVYLGFSIWLGIKGREIVWNSGVYQSVDAFKEGQKNVVKWVVGYVMIFFIGSLIIMGLVMKPYIDDPSLLDQRIREEVYQEAQSNNSSLNATEFYQGYDTGLAEGITNDNPKVNPTKTSSYREGYRYGYMISCIRKYDNEAVCLEKALSAM